MRVVIDPNVLVSAAVASGVSAEVLGSESLRAELGVRSSLSSTQLLEVAVYDDERVQDAVLALMHLNVHEERFGRRAWKTFPWEAVDGLHERGLISDPKSKAKSVALTEEGARLAERLFMEMFGTDESE